MPISIVGLDKTKLFAALYNRSKPQGLGFLQAKNEPMTEEEAKTFLNEDGSFDVDYVHGRIMKVSTEGDYMEERLYDRDLGKGAAAEVILCLREGR